MSKKIGYLFALAVLISISSLCFAQAPAKTARQVFNNRGYSNTGVGTGCGACFAYGGDLDAASSQANGLASEIDLVVPSAETAWAVIIPPGKTAVVNTLEANYLTLGCVVDPPQADWDVRTGVSSGNGGTVLASGTNAITITPTGRTAFGLTECRVSLNLPSALTLVAGEYWFGVLPYCTNSGNSTCAGGQRFFLSDSPDKPPANGIHYVPENQSFFNSSYFGYTWAPTWGPSGVCGGLGCQRFSAGLIGTP